MRNGTNAHGKRRAAKEPNRLGQHWARYRAWLTRLDRGQRIRYRLLQAATALSILIIVGYLFLRAWIQVPDLPDLDNNTQTGNQGDISGDVSFDGAEIPNVARSGRQEGVYTFLLVGRDTAGGGNTDTMILMKFDTVNQTVNAISLPRDTMINTSSSSKRLNAVYNYNKGKDKATQVEKGMTGLKNQVSKLTGITPDFYIMVEWDAIRELVDAIGGVEFEVPYNMDYDDPTYGQDLHIHQLAGLRTLTGEDAMQVIRWRKNNYGSPYGLWDGVGDTGRMKIQQNFLMVVAKQCLQPSIFLKAPALAQIFVDNVTTDLTVGNLLAFAQLAYGMNVDEDVVFVTVPYTGVAYRSASMVLPIQSKLLELLNDGINPYLNEITASDLQLVYKKSDGSYGVTTGTLADEKMGKVPVVTAPKPDEEDPIDTGDGSDIDDGDSSAGGTQPEPGDGSQPPDSGDGSQPPDDAGSSQGGASSGGLIPPIDPNMVLPDPNVQVPQDVNPQGTQSGDTVAVLPSRPEPIAPAA